MPQPGVSHSASSNKTVRVGLVDPRTRNIEPVVRVSATCNQDLATLQQRSSVPIEVIFGGCAPVLEKRQLQDHKVHHKHFRKIRIRSGLGSPLEDGKTMRLSSTPPGMMRRA